MSTRNGPPLQHPVILVPGMFLAFALGFVTSAGCGGAQTDDPTWNPAVNPTTQEAWEDKPRDESALLEILSVPDCEVDVDGKAAGKTPVSNYKVPPGSHDVTFHDEVTGDRTYTIVVQPGDAKTVKTDRPPRATENDEGAAKKKPKGEE